MPRCGPRALHSFLPGLAFAALALGAPALARAEKLICCNDERGVRICADAMPPQCVGRGYREINDKGITVRQVPPPPTAEEKLQLEAEEKRRKEEDAVRREQQRKDQALLNTYSTEKDIDLMRARAEQELNTAIRQAEDRLKTARERRKGLDQEAEFYQKRPMPSDLRKSLQDNDFEIKAQQDVIDSKHRDLETVRAKYEEDRRRYRALTTRPSPGARIEAPSSADSRPR